jgi:predicted nucleotidyltransferase
MDARPGFGEPLRQERTLAALADRCARIEALEGAIVVGSFADGRADALSDIDLLLCVRPGRFDEAWASRDRLHVTGALAAWDDRRGGFPEVGAHRWVTADIVLVEALIATPGSGVLLAPPWRVLAGPADLPDLFPQRPPIDRGTELRAASHPVERAFDTLKLALREAAAGREAADR